ncbi:MAG: hypothetical protein ACE10O_00585, partial [Candidatus Acidiferrales bacterium]
MRVENPQLRARLTDWGVEYRPDQRLAEWTSLGVGGTTDVLVIRQAQCLPDLIGALEAEGLRWRLLGGGSNLLVREGELPWVVLHLSARGRQPEFLGTRVRVQAAA